MLELFKQLPHGSFIVDEGVEHRLAIGDMHSTEE